MKTSDVVQFWGRQSPAARTWGTIGLVVLFGLTTLGMYFGIQVATYARAPQAGSGSPGPSAAPAADRLGPSPSAPSPSGPSSSGPSPSDTALTGLVPSPTPPQRSTPGGVPGAPGTVTVVLTDNNESRLLATVRWTAPAGGRPATGYVVTLHSGSDYERTVTAGTLETTFDIACDSACHGSQPSAAVRATNADGAGPQTAGLPGALPVISALNCFDDRSGFIECLLTSTGGTVDWTTSPPMTIYIDPPGHMSPMWFCAKGTTYRFTMTNQNQAGEVIRIRDVLCTSGQ